MKKKIGLISYHKDYNYGTLLQAYALSEIIDKMGYTSEYISYEAKQSKSFFKRFVSAIRYLFTDFKSLLEKTVARKAYDFFNNEDFLSTKVAFEEFYKNHIPHSDMIYTNQNLGIINSRYTNFIVGSDQTWSPFLCNGDSIFFLKNIGNNELKNSYAPSLGTNNFPQNQENLYKNELSTFNYLSCREKSGCEILERITNKKVEHVVDPTLLLNPKQWRSIMTPYEIKQPYILCYFLGDKAYVSEFAETLGKEKKIKVYYIVSSPTYLSKKNRLIGVSPQEFLFLIDNASYVCTDSFHGSLFSINFQKQFYSFLKRDGNSKNLDNGRIPALLKEFNLEIYLKENGDFTFENPIDYSTVIKILDNRKIHSSQYLEKILQINNI